MYIKNKSGPRIQPCGTPYKIEVIVNSWQLIETYCFLLDKEDLNHSFARPQIP